MRTSISRKLTRSGLVTLMIIALIVVASQIVVKFFRDSSTHLVIEYNELDAIQDFKISLHRLMIASGQYVIRQEIQGNYRYDILLNDAHNNLDICKQVITEYHERDFLQDFSQALSHIDSLFMELFPAATINDRELSVTIMDMINEEIESNLLKVNSLISETNKEIEEYIRINNTVIKHSTITSFALGIFIFSFLIVSGSIFIRRITKPLKELAASTNKISKGDRNAKVDIKTGDELEVLADSFNKMVDNLEKTTVSRNYLTNILDNMFDLLVVTDSRMRIRAANKAAIQMLEYTESELKGMILYELFNNDSLMSASEHDSEPDLPGIVNIINKENHIISKSGKPIPALLSCTVLHTENKIETGLILVGHDLSEKIAIEKKLEAARKERLVGIYEAQEEERTRIATDLHDGLGQILTGISYSIQDIFSRPEPDTVIEEESGRHLKMQIDTAIKEAKSLAHDLIPILLNDFGLVPAIRDLIDKANEMHNTKFSFEAFDMDERIDPKLEKALYRICQETMNNIINHAGATSAIYQIFRQQSAIVLVIEDNGVGIDRDILNAEKQSKGIGLFSIKERIAAFGGEFTINSEKNKGTEMIIELPCRKQSK